MHTSYTYSGRIYVSEKARQEAHMQTMHYVEFSLYLIYLCMKKLKREKIKGLQKYMFWRINTSSRPADEMHNSTEPRIYSLTTT